MLSAPAAVSMHTGAAINGYYLESLKQFARPVVLHQILQSARRGHQYFWTRPLYVLGVLLHVGAADHALNGPYIRRGTQVATDTRLVFAGPALASD